ncbi:hypothetical protein GCM10010170_084770 [Dactylosporangium salmoneum]|uniref:Uncharacterized protein n=1 Tax=Dactylosporangium salmoneum TaxID=53361 RepID=A0ABN3HFF0_9ACTN
MLGSSSIIASNKGPCTVAAALQGAVVGVVRAAIDIGGAEGARRLNGDWPA